MNSARCSFFVRTRTSGSRGFKRPFFRSAKPIFASKVYLSSSSWLALRECSFINSRKMSLRMRKTLKLQRYSLEFLNTNADSILAIRLFAERTA